MRRVLLVAVWSLAVLAVAVLVLVVTATVFLRTPTGSELLRGWLVGRVNREIAGHVRVGRLVFGGDWLVLHDAVLLDPDGRPVVRVAHLEVRVALWPLVTRKLELRRVEITRPVVTLRSDAYGSNLARALAPRRAPAAPSPPKAAAQRAPPPARPSGWLQAVELGSLRITEGVADWRGPAGRHVRVEDLRMGGHLRLDARTRTVAGAVRLETRGREPFDGALAADADVEWDDDRGSASLFIDGVAGRLSAAATVQPAGGGRGLRVEMHGRNLDLSVWDREAARTELAFDLTATLSGHGLDDVSGELDIEVPPSRLGTERVGPARLHASADDGAIDLRELHVSLPGLRLDGAGRLDPGGIHAHAEIGLRGLRASARSLLGPAALRRWPGDAVGRVALRVDGARSGPALHAEARLSRLRWQDTRATDLDVVVDVPSLAQPHDVRGRVKATALYLGERRLGGLAAALTTAGRDVQARVDVATPQPLAASAAGRWRPSWKTLDVERLQLVLPGGRWRLASPFPVTLGRKSLALGPAELVSGDQTLVLRLAQRGARLQAEARIVNLRLEAMPRILFGPGRHPRGTVNALLKAHGPMRQPSLLVSATLTDGGFGPVSAATAHLDARVERGRASGAFDLDAPEAALQLRFDVPATWPWPGAAPVDVAANLQRLDLARAANLAGKSELGVRGGLRGELVLHGTARAPSVSANLEGTALALRGQSLGDVLLDLSAAPGTAFVARVQARVFGRPSQVELQLDPPWKPLADELLSSGGWHALMRAPWRLRADLDRAPLASIAAFAGVPGPVGGTLSAKVRIEGHGGVPSGDVVLSLEDASAPRLPPTDVRLQVALADTVKVDVQVVRRGERLLVGTASLQLPATQLDDERAIEAAPLSADFRLGPVLVRRTHPVLAGGVPVGRVLQGRVQATLTIRGTPGDPQVSLKAAGNELRLDSSSLGEMRLGASYATRRAQATVDMMPPGARDPTLQVVADAAVDLSMGGLRAGVHPAEVPLDARLDARGLELVWMSGLVDGIRDLGGVVDAHLAAHGPLMRPMIAGEVRWQRGTALVEGVGAYHDITLELSIAPGRLRIARFSAESGGGKAALSGDVRREAVNLYALDAHAKLERFPIYVEGQKLAIMSVDGRAEGSISGRRLQGRVEVKEAHIELPSTKRRNLQGLAPAPDIVLVRDGKPIDAEQAKRLRKLTYRTEPVLAVESGPPRATLVIDAPRDLWVRSDDIEVELGLVPGFRIEQDGELHVFGEVTVRRGNVFILGRRLQFQEPSIIRFTGPPETPGLDVTTKYVAESQGIIVLIGVHGQGDRIALSLSSTPPHSESELYSLLITGRLGLSRGPTTSPTPSATSQAAGQAASLAGSLIASELQRVLRSRLPLDVLTIESGQTGVAGSRLEAGTYVTRNLYLGYVGRLWTDPMYRYQNRNAVHLEYQLTDAWSFQGEYGDAAAGSLDLVWTRRY